MKEALNILEKSLKSKGDWHKVVAQLEVIKTECDKGIEMKVAVGKTNVLSTFYIIKSIKVKLNIA